MTDVCFIVVKGMVKGKFYWKLKKSRRIKKHEVLKNTKLASKI